MVFNPARLERMALWWRLHQHALTVRSKGRTGESRWSLRGDLILFILAGSLRTTPWLYLVSLHLGLLEWRKL